MSAQFNWTAFSGFLIIQKEQSELKIQRCKSPLMEKGFAPRVIQQTWRGLLTWGRRGCAAHVALAPVAFQEFPDLWAGLQGLSDTTPKAAPTRGPG